MESSEVSVIERKIANDINGREKCTGWSVKDGDFRSEGPEMSLRACASRNDARFGAYEGLRLARGYLYPSSVEGEFSSKGGTPTRIVYRLSWGDVVCKGGYHSWLLKLRQGGV
jgi:hypothetical protein